MLNKSVLLLFLIQLHIISIVSFRPPTKEDQIRSMEKQQQEVEPFRKNLTECARQTKSTGKEVENFLHRVPQSTMQGKCFVACILKRNEIIVKNKVSKDKVIDTNTQVYGDNSEFIPKLKVSLKECMKAVEGIFEICEYASSFNDCMHLKMEATLDKVQMETRMKAMGDMADEPETWTDDDDVLQLIKDEL